MKQICLIFILITMWSCTYKSPPSQEIENADTGEWIYGNATSKPREELERLVLTGDINSYEELHIAYLDFNEPSLLPYALLMANKYDYTMAYYDVYDCLTMLYWNGVSSSISLDSLDKQTRAMALKYLKKAADKGDINALRDLGRLYLEGKHVKKDTILGNQLLEKYRKQSKNIR